MIQMIYPNIKIKRIYYIDVDEKEIKGEIPLISFGKKVDNVAKPVWNMYILHLRNVIH